MLAEAQTLLAWIRSSGSGPPRSSVLNAARFGTAAAASGAPTLIFMTRWLWQKYGVSLVVRSWEEGMLNESEASYDISVT